MALLRVRVGREVLDVENVDALIKQARNQIIFRNFEEAGQTLQMIIKKPAIDERQLLLYVELVALYHQRSGMKLTGGWNNAFLQGTRKGLRNEIENIKVQSLNDVLKMQYFVVINRIAIDLDLNINADAPEIANILNRQKEAGQYDPEALRIFCEAFVVLYGIDAENAPAAVRAVAAKAKGMRNDTKDPLALSDLLRILDILNSLRRLKVENLKLKDSLNSNLYKAVLGAA
jgi:hypothetical protein